MKAAVLGPGGLIGSAVAAELRARGHASIGIGHGMADRRADLDDPSSVAAEWFAGCGAVIHCAGVTDEEVKADLGRAAMRAMAMTERLINAARAEGVSRFVYVSSAHVYGRLSGEIDEATAVNPLSDYALLHFAAEQVLQRNLKSDERGLVLRPCAVFGPLPDPDRFRRWSLVPFSFPRDAATQGEIRLASAGTQIRNFVSSEAIGAAVVDWLEKLHGGMTVANVLGVDNLTILALAERSASIYQQLTGRHCVVTHPIAGPGSAEPPLRYRSRVDRPRAGLPLDQHLENIINAYRDIGVTQ